MVAIETKILIAGIYIGFALIELIAGRFSQREHTTRRDVFLDVASTFSVTGIVLPTIIVLAPGVAEWMFPGSEGRLAHLPWWAMAGLLLVADDMTQYWWHRLSHTELLYPLHRAHHSATYMSVRIVYRNNLIYYSLMPGVWFSGMLIHWGFGEVYAVYLVIKLSVIIGAHSSVPWDEPLYRNRYTRPLMWVVERVISTPSTHAAHHGLNADDGITHYHGNYGNLLFLWDVIFGTAHITRKRPAAYGIENLEQISLFHEFLFPTPLRHTTETEGSAIEKKLTSPAPIAIEYGDTTTRNTTPPSPRRLRRKDKVKRQKEKMGYK